MAKSQKSKILATALCTAVMAGLYAGPVMAADTGLTVGTAGKVVADTTVTINGVTLAGNKVTATNGEFTTVTIGGKTLSGTTVGKVNDLFNSSAATKPVIYAGNNSVIGGVKFNNGAVSGVTSLTATGTITGNAITANGKLTAKGGSSITYASGSTSASSTVSSYITDKVTNGTVTATTTTRANTIENKVTGTVGANTVTSTATVNTSGMTDKLTVKNTDTTDLVAEVTRQMTSSGIVDTYKAADGTTHTVTTNAKGTTFAGTGATGTTVINGGSITTGSLTVGGMEIKAGATSGTVEIGGITLKKDTATGGLAVDALDIENVTLNKNGFKLDAANAANGFAVEGASGALKVKDINDTSTMVYTTAKDGTNTMWLDTATGNLSTVGTVSIGGELGGTAKVVIDGATGSIKVGEELFAVDGATGNTKLEGELKVNNGLVVGTEGEGTFKVKNIGGNTMAYMVDKDGNYTVGINAQNGNIETKGALAVTNAEGNNVFTANSDGMSVGGGNFAVDAATGNTKIAGGLNVGTNIEVAGGITASSLKLGAIDNVEATINALDEGLGNVGEAVNGLEGKVNVIENKTTGISYDKGVTTIAETAKFGKGYMQVGSTILAKDGSIGAANGKFTVTPDGEVIVSGENGSTNINGNGITVGDTAITNGVITTHKADIGGVEIANGRVDGVDVSELAGSVFDSGKDITELERKTQDISYDNGVTTVSGVDFANGTITAGNGNFTVSENGVVTASAVNTNIVMFEGGSIMSTGIRAIDGKFIVDAEGNVKAAGDVTSTNYSLETIGNQVKNVEGITRVDGVTDIEGVAQFGNGSVKVTGTMQVAGDKFVYSYQDEEGNLRVGTLKKIDSSIDELYDTVGNVGGDLTALTGRVENVEDKTQNIRRIGNATIFSERVGINDRGLSIAGNDGGTAIDITKEGNITAVGEIKGANVYSANYDLETVGYNTQGISYAGGVTTVSGVEFADGAITADKLTLGEIDDVEAYIKGLDEGIGNVGNNTAGITRDELTATTTIEGATSFDATGMVIESMGGTTSIVGGQATFMGQNGFTQIMGGNITTNTINGVNFSDWYNKVNDNLEDLNDKTQNITGSGETGNVGEGGNQIEVPPTTGGETGINGDVTVGGNLTAGSGTIGGVTMEDGKVTAGEGSFGSVNVGGENGTNITGDKITIGNTNPDEDAEDKSSTVIEKGDVTVTDKDGNEHSIMGNAEAIDGIREDMGAMSNRISKVEDRIDKVGAMSAAIANLRTMGYDPTAPTEIAVGVGQYRSETGAALGLFHYPNRDFMLSLSVSTSGDEVMGGIGATWKFGRKTPEQMLQAEQEKAAKAKVAKALAMKKAAEEAKVAAQQAKHAKMAAEKAAK